MPDLTENRSGVRPLLRLACGRWRSCDGRWLFLRHQGEPHPNRWFVFEGDDKYPCNERSGTASLTEAVDWAEAEARAREAADV